MGKQKTASAGAPKDDAVSWTLVDCDRARGEVRRLQLRIAKAVKDSWWSKAHTLQHLLTRSLYAKLVAVKRVTSTTIADSVLEQTFHTNGKIIFTTRRLRASSPSSKKVGYIIREPVFAPLPALLKTQKQMRQSLGHYYQHVVASEAYNRGATTGASNKGVLLECLSRMTGNCHVRF